MIIEAHSKQYICSRGSKSSMTKTNRAESAIMRQVVLWDTACNFNAVILNQSIFNCLITSASTLSLLFLASILQVRIYYLARCTMR